MNGVEMKEDLKNTKQKKEKGNKPGPFLESPVNFSSPKIHFKNCDPVILKSWSFTMISRNERANLLQNFIPGNVFVF